MATAAAALTGGAAAEREAGRRLDAAERLGAVTGLSCCAADKGEKEK
ncbi:hypothetical protein [Synechococcus sp. CCFWC 502]|nr:hypothetical protein [Synechococcus sp. CCFWC 502]WFN58201.1 hypothetical protein N4320_10285 [Synechococcus sp. CCFWC 502]